MLVYRAVAADARPGDGSASSDAFFIEISKLGVAAGDAFTLPEEETRYALSQQMLIIKTERLHAAPRGDAAGRLRERGAEPRGRAADDSRRVRVHARRRGRRRGGRGGAVDGAAGRTAAESRSARPARRDDRDEPGGEAADRREHGRARWSAERAAVAALQRAFSRDRYILRALATRSQLDPARRLTGSLAEATDWRRDAAGVPANRRAALLQDLLPASRSCRQARDRTSRARAVPSGFWREAAMPASMPRLRRRVPASRTRRARSASRGGDPWSIAAACGCRDGRNATLQRAAAAADATAARALPPAAARRRRRAACGCPLAGAVGASSGAFADAMRRARR